MRYEPTNKLGYTEIELLMMPFVDMDTDALEPDWQRLDAVGQALSMLTEEEQWVIYRMFYDRVTYEELKNNLGIKAKSHAWRKTRLALESLKKELLKNPLFKEMKDDYYQPDETTGAVGSPETGSDNNGTTKG
jgi:hypothetical protein